VIKDKRRFMAGSLPAQSRDDCTCPGELPFKIASTWRIASIAHRFKGRIDLAEGSLSHASVPTPLSKEH